MEKLSTIELIKIFYTKKEIVYLGCDGKNHFTNNENICDKFSCIFTSDFETMFEIKNELLRRDNINLNRYYSRLLKRVNNGL